MDGGFPNVNPYAIKKQITPMLSTAVSRNTLSVLCRSICATFLNTNSTPVEEDKIDNVFVGERHVLFDLRLSRRDSTN
jgi:hypothetical protein